MEKVLCLVEFQLLVIKIQDLILMGYIHQSHVGNGNVRLFGFREMVNGDVRLFGLVQNNDLVRLIQEEIPRQSFGLQLSSLLCGLHLEDKPRNVPAHHPPVHHLCLSVSHATVLTIAAARQVRHRCPSPAASHTTTTEGRHNTNNNTPQSPTSSRQLLVYKDLPVPEYSHDHSIPVNSDQCRQMIVMDDHQRPDGIPVTRFTLHSIYALSDDEKLQFEYESGNTNIVVNVYTSQPEISRQVDIFIRKMNSVPAFTANLTVESFNKRTLS
ncbi:mitotic spindle checkpoint protein MAD1-like [Salvia divinorum]|uniref:Mitotic spindle checkpoint protein MAD1-like n=1 Tax=Salvia divinorum TaxID=28513 RepID=A0ABD1FSX7_SALDI